MQYRFAEEKDIEEICSIVNKSIAKMIENEIFQWDEIYPTREDFLEDIRKKHLHVGVLQDEIAVIYALNKECEPDYADVAWKYPDMDYRVIHRLCVNPKYQRQGIAKRTLLHIEEELQKIDIHEIHMDVFSQNRFALALYLANGFEKVGETEWRKGKFYFLEKRL